ncbi:MAG: hypothetical protein SOZ50_07845 [Sodaliphilus sp.]|nr:hypothetical protein [Sodaliphilus sp.]
MKKFFYIIIMAVLTYQFVAAKSASDVDRITVLEEKCSVLQSKQENADDKLNTLADEWENGERKIDLLKKDNKAQQLAIDSLRNTCSILEKAQTADRKDINGKINATDNNVRVNQDMLQSRTLWGIMIIIILLALVTTGSYLLAKRIKSGDTSIDEVRKAQEALEVAQKKMQEESIKLDNQMLAIVQKQLESKPTTSARTAAPDHSLALKVADEIVRIELNMSRMDSSIKGYKQLSKAVERIKDNFNANGYEIVDMLGKPYNEGMKVTANFVADEDLEEGKQIITGITKPQINYNGLMIQAAQITVSQNI